MYSLAALERAAESLCMRSVREGPVLKVLLVGNIAVRLSEEDGRMTRRVTFLKWFTAANALLSGYVTIIFLVQPFTRVMGVLVFITLSGVWATHRLNAEFERLQERLFDRAYDLGKLSPAALTAGAPK